MRLKAKGTKKRGPGGYGAIFETLNPSLPEGWEQIGTVLVDTASILIVDPCRAQDFDYDEYVDKTDFNELARQGNVAQYFEDIKGVISHTGIGDGNYPVYARIDKNLDGHLGKRVTAIWIPFFQDEVPPA